MPEDTAPDWNDLRCFLAAAQAGSLAGAARLLGVEHTTVGRRLQALERRLGGALVLRRPDGLVLTPLGERVLEAARPMQAAADAVQASLRREPQRVRLALPSGFASLFAPWADTLRQADPPIVLELLGSSRAVDLARGEADVAVRGGPLRDPDLVTRRLGAVGWSLYAAPSHLQRQPVAPGPSVSLAGHALIGFDDSLADTPNARWLEAQASGAQVVMRGRELVDIAAAAASGAGIALLPCLMGDASPALVRLTPQVPVSRDMVLAYRPELRGTAAVRRVVDVVVDVFRDNARLIAGE